MSAPQGSGLSQQTYYPNPGYYLGQLTSDPSSPSVGQWWYRTDTGQIKMYTQNGIVTLQYQTTEIISSDTAIGGTNVYITSRLVVLPGVTLTIYGSVMFTQDVLVFGTLLSSNPSASSSAPSTNSYNLRGNLYLDGTYSIAQYNTDQINYLGGFSFIQTPGSFSVSGTLALNISLTLSASFTFSGNGTLTVNSGYTLTLNTNATFTVSTVSGAGTLSIASGYTLTIGANTTISVPTISGSGTLSIASGYTLTIGASATFSVPTVSGAGTLSIASGYTLTVNSNTTFAVPTISGSGALVINSGYTLAFSGSTLMPSTLTVSGTLALSGNYTLGSNIPNVAGTLQINSGYTLTVSSNLTLAYSTITGAGTLSIASGYTLTIGANTTISVPTISGSGALSIASGYTLTIGASATFSVSTVSGAGTLSIASGYTLTQAAALTVSVSTVKVAGTWANAGYDITIPSGTTVSWNVSGSITTGSTAGTLTVNGTCTWIGSGMGISGTDAQATFILSLAGSGIFISAPAGKGTASAAISLSSTALGVDGETTNITSSGGIPYYSLTTISGSAVGKYTIGTLDATSSVYYNFIFIYIGTANTNYSISGYFGFVSYNTSGHKVSAYNMAGSAGTITLTGTCYV